MFKMNDQDFPLILTTTEKVKRIPDPTGGKPYDVWWREGKDAPIDGDFENAWADRVDDSVGAPALVPSPFIEGNWYVTQAGARVRCLGFKGVGTTHETWYDAANVHRYSRRDFGRVTGSAHDYSEPRNCLPPGYVVADGLPVDPEVTAVYQWGGRWHLKPESAAQAPAHTEAQIASSEAEQPPKLKLGDLVMVMYADNWLPAKLLSLTDFGGIGAKADLGGGSQVISGWPRKQWRLPTQAERAQHEGPKVGEWVRWEGGECPVASGARVSIRFRDMADVENTIAHAWKWQWEKDLKDARGDIIAYRIVE